MRVSQALDTLNCTFMLFMPLQLGRVWFAEKDVENGLIREKRRRSNKANGSEEVLAAATWIGGGRRKCGGHGSVGRLGQTSGNN